MDKNIAIDTIIAEEAPFREIASGEPEWLYNLRQRAWEYYRTSPLPERTSNVWRYTDPAEFVKTQDELLSLMAQHYSGEGIDRGPADSSVILKDLNSASCENQDVAEKYFGQIIGSEFGKFEALNMAFWNSGLFLYIPSNLVLEKPIYLNRKTTGANAFQRLLIVIGENTQATIIDDYDGRKQDKAVSVNSAVELFADDSSNVRYVNIQRLNRDIKTYMTIRSRIGQNANLKSIFGSTGSLLTKVNAGTILSGRGANSQMYGAVFGDEGQHFDYHTLQHHTSSESFSNLNFKVVLKDKAKSAYTGLIRIEKDTVNCEAYQENRNLLLNRGTKADSIPELEILTDQVRCTHGATMGPIDPEQVFYLKSRGVGETEAVRMIVSGFMESLLAQLPDDIAKVLRDLIFEKLEGERHGTGVH